MRLYFLLTRLHAIISSIICFTQSFKGIFYENKDLMLYWHQLCGVLIGNCYFDWYERNGNIHAVNIAPLSIYDVFICDAMYAESSFAVEFYGITVHSSTWTWTWKMFIRQEINSSEKQCDKWYILYTAGVRVTQRYYSAWTGTMHMKCWHFWGINLVFATQKKTPNCAKRLLDIRGAHNWQSHKEGKTSCDKMHLR